MFELKLGHWLNFSLDCQVIMRQQHEMRTRLKTKRTTAQEPSLERREKSGHQHKMDKFAFDSIQRWLARPYRCLKTLNRRKFHAEQEFNNIVDKFVVKVIKQRNC